MCLILDTNRFGDALGAAPKPAYLPLIDWVTDPKKGGWLVYGGTKYRKEVDRAESARRFFAVLKKAGRAHEADGAKVDAEEKALVKAKACASDDEHIVALARISGARVICTDDAALIKDFKNKGLLGKPKGSVYSEANHAHLLAHHSSCPKPPA